MASSVEPISANNSLRGITLSSAGARRSRGAGRPEDSAASTDPAVTNKDPASAKRQTVDFMIYLYISAVFLKNAIMRVRELGAADWIINDRSSMRAFSTAV
jgi:hypothetical protein